MPGAKQLRKMSSNLDDSPNEKKRRNSDLGSPTSNARPRLDNSKANDEAIDTKDGQNLRIKVQKTQEEATENQENGESEEEGGVISDFGESSSEEKVAENTNLEEAENGQNKDAGK
jgi:hypothetical protein